MSVDLVFFRTNYGLKLLDLLSLTREKGKCLDLKLGQSEDSRQDSYFAVYVL